MSETNEKPPLLSRAGRWLAELVLVFVGVYAAFSLNNYQQHREQALRRDQILATLEQQLQRSIESGRHASARQDREVTAFQSALEAGKMPALHPFVFITDYDPSDVATLLQSGGVQLLDMKTLAAIRRLESVIRWGLSNMARYQALSDELIVPNLGQGAAFFYDPATKRLRRRFEIYPQALQARAKFAHDLEQAQLAVLDRIQAELGR